MKRIAILCSIIASFVLIPIKASGQITISNTEARDKIVALDPYNFCGIGIDENGYLQVLYTMEYPCLHRTVSEMCISISPS